MQSTIVSSYRSAIFRIVVSTVLLSSCAVNQSSPEVTIGAALPTTQSGLSVLNADDSGSLYAALGRAPGVASLTDQFITELASDNRIRHRFANSDIGRFHGMLELHICELAKGPCVYTGDSMKRTHGGMDIQSAEFNAVVEALMRAMDSLDLKIGTQNRLLATMAPMQADIVGQ